MSQVWTKRQRCSRTIISRSFWPGTARAKVKAFRQLRHENNQPQPHHGQSACPGGATRASLQVQCEIRSSLSLHRYTLDPMILSMLTAGLLPRHGWGASADWPHLVCRLAWLWQPPPGLVY
jgi:hypothetical protein